jgi:hypothetical protein
MMTPTTRYLCPLPGCGWHHDEPDLAAEDALRFTPAPSASTPSESIASMVEQSLLGRAARVEAAIKQHVETHSVLEWMREVDRLQSTLRQVGYVTPPETGPDDEQLSKICYARNGKGMLCDRKRGHDGEHVDIYGPRGGTWAKGEPPC